MNRYTLTLLIVAVFVVGLLPFSVAAQETPLTCDGGPNDVLSAAQTAYDGGDFETAQELVEQAMVLCKGTSGMGKARSLKMKIERAIEIDMAEPGLVDLGDHSLFMTCIGNGSPTVIFENGWGQPRETWKNIPQDVSQTTRVCTYDRIGHGFSDPYPPDMTFTAQDQVDDLVQLLETAGIEPPYILVGHCALGMNLRLFADQYPDRVAGLVMVDAFVPGLFFEQGADLLDGVRTLGMDTERLDLDTSLQQVDAVGLLGDLPLVVLTAYMWTPIPRDDWIALQAAFLAHSTNSYHIIAEHSRHYIMDTEPELIVDAILWVLEQAGPTE